MTLRMSAFAVRYQLVLFVGTVLLSLPVTVLRAQEVAPLNLASRANSLDGGLDFLQGVLGCRLVAPKIVSDDILPVTVYASSAAGCNAVNNLDNQSAGQFFTDQACEIPFDYSPTSVTDYCAISQSKSNLGNAAALTTESEAEWTLAYGSLFDFGALSTKNLKQPFMARVKYKSVQTAGGRCDLEMRIYKQSPTATGLKSLVAFHGGSWTSRGFGFFGTEMTVPHYTDSNYVVFAPFYRLLDTKEGNAACNDATIQQITQDADDALQWVVNNAKQWGGSDFPVVFGQSAGAHLAASLAVNRPEQVSNAVLFYPPTDFTDFALEVRNGNYTNEQGLDILERVIGEPFDTINLSASPIVENSFPSIVEVNPERYPPMFMLHGLADELVEARQSTRLCNALNGDVAGGLDIETIKSNPELRQIYGCDDRGSSLHLINEGDHALDVCLVELLSDACQSGSPASVSLVEKSVRRSISWATEISDQEIAALTDVESPGGTTSGITSDGAASGGSGSLSVHFLVGLLLLISFRASMLILARREF